MPYFTIHEEIHTEVEAATAQKALAKHLASTEDQGWVDERYVTDEDGEIVDVTL